MREFLAFLAGFVLLAVASAEGREARSCAERTENLVPALAAEGGPWRVGRAVGAPRRAGERAADGVPAVAVTLRLPSGITCLVLTDATLPPRSAAGTAGTSL